MSSAATDSVVRAAFTDAIKLHHCPRPSRVESTHCPTSPQWEAMGSFSAHHCWTFLLLTHVVTNQTINNWAVAQQDIFRHAAWRAAHCWCKNAQVSCLAVAFYCCVTGSLLECWLGELDQLGGHMSSFGHCNFFSPGPDAFRFKIYCLALLVVNWMFLFRHC